MTTRPGALPGEWSWVALDQDITVQVDQATSGTDAADVPGLVADLEAEVEGIWSAERVRHPALFNGRVFSADKIDAACITGHWTEYRRVLAQIRKPTLFTRLNIRPLAVNGLLECVEGLLFGRRQADAIYLPGWWQAAPAGNVEARTGDGVDLTSQLFTELQEELGLPPEVIEMIMPVAAIEHALTHVVDVGFLLRTSLSFGDIQRRRQQHGNDEYDLLRTVAPEALEQFLAENGPTLLPSARILIERWSGRQS